MKKLLLLLLLLPALVFAQPINPPQSISVNNAAGASAVNIQDGGNTITVDGTIAATQSGAWTNACTQSGTWNITNVSGTVSLPTGAATSANQSTEITALQLIDNIVSGSGVNVSQINGVTPLMGNGVTGTGSHRVTIASDNTPFSVNATSVNTASTTMTEATCGVTTTSASCLASSGSRKSGYIQNNSDTTIWCSLGGTAVAATPSSQLFTGGVLSLTTGNVIYTGAVNCIHAGSGTKNVTVASN